MLNQLVLVGRIVRDPEVKELDSGKKVSHVTLAIPRNYKNENGIYDTDFVNCTLWGGIAENTVNYCKKGDVVGVKGRVQTRLVENENKLEIVAEKLTFLTKAKEKEIEKDEEER